MMMDNTLFLQHLRNLSLEEGRAYIQEHVLELTDQAAIECLDAAGEEFLCLGDEGNWARTRISWMIATASLSRLEEALQHAARARDVFLRLGESYWVCVIDHNIAWVYMYVGRYRDALELFERLSALLPTFTDQSETAINRSIAIAEEGQAQILSWLGKFEQA